MFTKVLKMEKTDIFLIIYIIHIKKKIKFNMNIKPVLVIENSLDGLKLNESASVVKSDKIILSGIFTEFDVKNRNERIYTKDRFLPHLNELNERMKTLGVIYGEFDHPDVFDTSLSRVSHVIETISFNSENNRVDGSIRLLNTHYGREAKALVLDGCPIFVSSRAAGVTESDGTVTVKKLFTYDAVADPGFASTRMNVKVLNESLGFNESANFRIYDMSDESKFNELYEMNKDEQVTKTQLEDYSNYLNGEIAKIKESIDSNIKVGNDPAELNKLAEYYAALTENFNKVTKYLDYLADNMQIMVTENSALKERTENLVKHNDYLAEQLEKSINYSEYLGEKVNDNVNYSEYIAKKLDESIQFSEYIAENANNNIQYSEYLAEQIDNNIQYSEYLAEHTESSLKTSEHLREYVDNTVGYAEYLAENIDENIKYSKYLAENIDNGIAYSEYVANELNDTQAYSKYIAESLDKTIDGIKGKKINEDMDQSTSDFRATNVDQYYQDNADFQETDSDLPEELEDLDDQTQVQPEVQPQVQEPVQNDEVVIPHEVHEPEVQEPYQAQYDEDILGKIVKVETEDGQVKTGEVLTYNSKNGIAVVELTPEVPVQGQVQGQPVQTQVQEPVQTQVQGQPVQTQVQVPVQVQQPQTQIEVHESKFTVIGDKLLEKEKTLKQNISKNLFEILF